MNWPCALTHCWTHATAATEWQAAIADAGIKAEDIDLVIVATSSPDDMFGEWSKNSIYQHIVYHTNDEGVQLQECESILYSQIQSLRQKTWIETEDGLQPHHRNISLLDKLVKSFTDTVSKRKTRK